MLHGDLHTTSGNRFLETIQNIVFENVKNEFSFCFGFISENFRNKGSQKLKTLKNKYKKLKLKIQNESRVRKLYQTDLPPSF